MSLKTSLDGLNSTGKILEVEISADANQKNYKIKREGKSKNQESVKLKCRMQERWNEIVLRKNMKSTHQNMNKI